MQQADSRSSETLQDLPSRPGALSALDNGADFSSKSLHPVRPSAIIAGDMPTRFLKDIRHAQFW
jgi:hypothetical protein